MSAMSNIFPYVGQVLLVATLITLLPAKLLRASKHRIGIVTVLLVLGLFVPVYGLSIAQWLRSVAGDLSMITLAIFANILAQRLFQVSIVRAATMNALLPGLALLGLLFYPLSLGVSGFDPYQLGYSPLLMACILILLSIISWARSRRGLAIMLILPLLAFNMHLLESANLWDYLLDPVVVIYAVVQSILRLDFYRLIKGTGVV